MEEIEIAGNTYRIGKLSALTQFHMARRLAPLLAAVGVTAGNLKSAATLDLAELVGPASEVLARMSEADVNYVLFGCLDAVQRKQGDRFAPVQVREALMFQDLEMPSMVRLVIEVLRTNLGSFFDLVPERSA